MNYKATRKFSTYITIGQALEAHKQLINSSRRRIKLLSLCVVQYGTCTAQNFNILKLYASNKDMQKTLFVEI